MSELNEPVTPTTKPRTSKRNTILFIIVLLILLMGVLGFLLNYTKNVIQDEFCRRQVEGLWIALTVYSNDYDNQLPPVDQWCDLLIAEADVHPRSLICCASDAIEGESTYAININAFGKRLDQLPPDMVLVFETDYGIEKGPRNTPIRIRNFHSFFEKRNDSLLANYKDRMVYLHRWNLAGGPEMLTTQYHRGKGCNVAFANGHANWVPTNKISTLRWTSQKQN
jgi:hypothetical protein